MPSLSLLEAQMSQLQKALEHLRYSYNKINRQNIQPKEEDEEAPETWESFSSRFARVVDIFLSKFLRTYVLYHDPGFKGSMRDFINLGEKLDLIEDSDWWLGLRELRNIAAHEYNEDDLAAFYKSLFSECPQLLRLSRRLSNLSFSS
jgi:hypothetical protein